MAATNSSFRTETRYEHLYNHIELFNGSCSPIDAPAANRTRYQDCRDQQTKENQIATGRRMYSDYRTESNNEHLYNNTQSINEASSPATESQAANQTSHCSFRQTQRRMAALNAFRAESRYENLYDHKELSNMQSLPRCLPSGAPPVNQTYQEEAVYQNYEGNNRPVATNSAFRAKPNDEHLYNHIQLSNRQPVPSGAPAANQIYQEEVANQNYEGNNRPQEPMKNIAICHSIPFAVIAVLVLFLLATVGASISLAIMMYSEGGRVFDEIEQLKELEEETRVNLYNVSADLKDEIDEIEATSVNQTVKMQRIGDEIKAANKNQTKEMQRIGDEIKAANKNQTKEMQRIGDEIKAANKNQTKEMQQMTKNLKKAITTTMHGRG